MSEYRIHPAIGVARIGNSAHSFYVAPETIGGLPTEYDPEHPDAREPVKKFKDGAGQIRRQAARFQIFRRDEQGCEKPISIEDGDVESIEWRVHIANKKAAWYQFSELAGDTMLGQENSYEARGVALRNADVHGRAERQKLIIDPGPRTVGEPGQKVQFDATDAPKDYHHVSFPPADLQPQAITSLGELIMQKDGGLLVLGGLGNTGGAAGTKITTFAGANNYYDDTADGPVTATLKLKGQDEPIELQAWVIAASPKFAPELVNPVTLNDIIFDMAVRYKGAEPAIFRQGSFDQDYVVDFDRQILPIFKRMRRLQWVANVAAMVEFASPDFDIRDATEANKANREVFFSFLRKAGHGEAAVIAPSHEQAFAENGFPLMPLNSGTNSVSNINISKFLTLTPTQYFFFEQWAAGKFEISRPRGQWPNQLDEASVGNCVGAPMCPGIEVTWSLRNPKLYDDLDPYRILVEEGVDYAKHGLSPSRDETDGGGCQPGDLSKRMAVPWQADFSECSLQPVSLADPAVNQTGPSPFLPPALQVYWWPAQSPWQVYTGSLNGAEQVLDAQTPAGVQVFYQRGLNSFEQVIEGWSYLGFILNQTEGSARDQYPYFVERERDFSRFSSAGVGFKPDGTLVSTVKTEEIGPADTNNVDVQLLFFNPSI